MSKPSGGRPNRSSAHTRGILQPEFTIAGMAQSLNPAPILRAINTVGNLLGATVAFFYLRVIDPAETNMMDLGLIEIAYSLLIVATLIGIGQWWSARWL